jgi:hypothetical protein
MAYIGNQNYQAYVTLSNQTFVTSGATTIYALNYTVTNANNISLYINNVAQQPGVAYTASGNTLTLTTATSSSMYAVYLGQGIQTVTPGATSVGTAQMNYPLGNFRSTGITDSGTTTALTIDSSGDVGIGTTSPQYFANYSSLTVGSSSSKQGMVYITDGTINYWNYVGSGVAWTGTLSNTPYAIQTNNTERMRIDTSGNLLVGKTTTADTTAGVCFGAGANNIGLSSGNYLIVDYTAGGSGYTLIDFRSAGTEKGSITYNGTNVLYNTTSDQRLKENIVDAGTALQKIQQIKIREFDWIDSKIHETHGIIAQELQQVTPQCITEGTTNNDGSIGRPWQVDTSPLIPMLIKAIQELNTQITQQQSTITQLQADVAALKTKVGI